MGARAWGFYFHFSCPFGWNPVRGFASAEQRERTHPRSPAVISFPVPVLRRLWALLGLGRAGLLVLGKAAREREPIFWLPEAAAPGTRGEAGRWVWVWSVCPPAIHFGWQQTLHSPLSLALPESKWQGPDQEPAYPPPRFLVGGERLGRAKKGPGDQPSWVARCCCRAPEIKPLVPRASNDDIPDGRGRRRAGKTSVRFVLHVKPGREFARLLRKWLPTDYIECLTGPDRPSLSITFAGSSQGPASSEGGKRGGLPWVWLLKSLWAGMGYISGVPPRVVGVQEAELPAGEERKKKTPR